MVWKWSRSIHILLNNCNRCSQAVGKESNMGRPEQVHRVLTVQFSDNLYEKCGRPKLNYQFIEYYRIQVIINKH
jgi:hypothetical protein